MNRFMMALAPLVLLGCADIGTSDTGFTDDTGTTTDDTSTDTGTVELCDVDDLELKGDRLSESDLDYSTCGQYFPAGQNVADAPSDFETALDDEILWYYDVSCDSGSRQITLTFETLGWNGGADLYVYDSGDGSANAWREFGHAVVADNGDGREDNGWYNVASITLTDVDTVGPIDPGAANNTLFNCGNTGADRPDRWTAGDTLTFAVNFINPDDDTEAIGCYKFGHNPDGVTGTMTVEAANGKAASGRESFDWSACDTVSF